MDFSETITSKAFNTLHTRKFNPGLNAPRISPLSADITALYKHLKNKLNALMAELKEDATNANIWYKFAKACVAYSVIFNRRRRPGETGRLTILIFQKAKSSVELDSEVMKCFTESERALARSLKIVQIRGKRGRKVPLLFNRLMYSAVSTLVSRRRQFSVHKVNPHVFAIPGNSSSNIGQHDVLREEAKECGAEDPKNDVDILASFMGHDTRTHREFYRISDEALQLARASKFFTLLDRGELTLDQGKI
ncbi:Thiamine-phosphate synthase [Frankliniella fusca]|uniref:Thiamine-phosphate synthase n=1 Tax=Frankliniella fusca TaxID=407009 RepID=A0AAE1GWT7_9NEOP|nr:Thiamine-phosphate synthase [Frankliniella fusca]